MCRHSLQISKAFESILAGNLLKIQYEWLIECRPIPLNDSLKQWFATRLEKEIINEDKELEPIVVRKLAIESDRAISYRIDEDLLDNHLLWEFFGVDSRLGLDGQIFTSHEIENGHSAVIDLVESLR